jgi:hypothetical protein
MDRSSRGDNNKNYFEQLNQWVSPPPKQHNLNDFHRTNQDFLSKLDQRSVTRSPSVRDTSQRYVWYIVGTVFFQ